MKPERDGEARRKLRLLLTPSELAKLDTAVQDTWTTRSLIILEALQAGLAEPELKINQEKRDRRVDAWTTNSIKERVRLLAAQLHVTQQHLIRTLLLAYLASAPWNPKPHRNQGTEGGGQVAA